MSSLKRIFLLTLILLGCAGVVAPLGAEESAKSKYLIVLQAGRESHEGMARAVHAFLYSRELKASGYEVVLMFDGAGTEWVHELTDPGSESPILSAYEKFRKEAGIQEIVCDYCAGAFHVKQELKERNIQMTSEYEGHPSIAKWADQGYQILIL